MNTIALKMRKFFPKGILSRFLLIILIPIFLVQMIFVCIFFKSYWETLNKRAIDILSTEIVIINNEIDKQLANNLPVNKIIENINKQTNLYVDFLYPNQKFAEKDAIIKSASYGNFIVYGPLNDLKNEIKDIATESDSLYILKGERKYELYLKKKDGYFLLSIPKRRIETLSIWNFIFWSTFPCVMLLVLAYIFAKNQIRSIKILTQAMADFSLLEKETENFKPSGATEIRIMGIAFSKMQKEIKKFIGSRTLMLAEVSHDLCTPLTRIKLDSEFIEDADIAESIKKNIIEMERMIDDYLLFAKGEKDNRYEEVYVITFFNGVINDYKKGGYNNITMDYTTENETIFLKSNLFKRAINNIINNSLRYANNIHISIKADDKNLSTTIDDDGPGISEEFYKKITQPFIQLKRNVGKQTSDNVGLGLSITKNIVSMHKGKIFFDKSKAMGGLSVKIVIPIQ